MVLKADRFDYEDEEEEDGEGDEVRTIPFQDF